MATTGSVQVKNGKYYAVLNLYDENGKRKPKWVPTGLEVRGNKRNAEKFLHEEIARRDKKNVPYSKITVAEYFKMWLDDYKTQVKPNTYRNYYGNMTNHIIPYFERQKILLQELKPHHLEKYYSIKQRAGSCLESDEALSATTIKHHHQNISIALTEAVRRGLITYNPAKSARTPKTEKYVSNFLNTTELNELLTLYRGTVIEIPVTLCAVYGFRRSEVLGLRWKYISFENRSITIAETLQQGVGGNYQDTPKTKSSYRTLPMTDEVYSLLLEHKVRQAERKAVMGEHYTDNDYVCTWNDGRVVTPNYLSTKFHKIISKSMLPKIRFHELRHSAASNLLNMGFSCVQVQEWLGHSSAATTLNFYAHADKSSKISMATAISEALRL